MFGKASLSREMLQLPSYWWKVWRGRDRRMTVERIRYGKQHRQYILFCPDVRGELQGQVIFIHGGAWHFGRPEMFLSHARVLNDWGYRVFLPSFRRPPLYNFSHISRDLKAVMAELNSYRKERLPTFLGGMSSGGHLAALIAFDTRILSEADWSARDLSGVFTLGAPLDLSQMPSSLLLSSLFGFGRIDRRQADPRRLLKTAEPVSVLCVQADGDGLVPVASAEAFVREYKRCMAGEIRYHLIDNSTHLDTAGWFMPDNRANPIVRDFLSNSG
ncbi:MAG: alpha/beta hydrolase fold domain-containing protein [Saprospiraceae bacterium]|nr:alpha/beta hydrolase fold domain-containing protein [Saprospiraceae bacterium]